VRSLAFARDGQVLASAGLDRSVQLWEMPSGKHVRTLGQAQFPIFALRFAPDGRLVTAGGDPREALQRPGEVLAWDLVHQRTEVVHRGHTNTATAVVLPRLRHWVVITAGADKSVRRGSY
jgi:WD40 repeat protein